MQKCAFFDRDGVINEDFGYVHQKEDFRFYEGLFELLKLLKAHNYLLLIITNQSGINRGLYTESHMHTLHSFMQESLQQILGFGFDKIYYCPHTPEQDCTCRKPQSGMITQACQDFKIDLKQSLFIGDKITDMQCAQNGGVAQKFLLQKTDENPTSKGYENIENLYHITSLHQLYSIIAKTPKELQ